MMAEVNYNDLMMKNEKQLMIMVLQELKEIKSELNAIKMNVNLISTQKDPVKEMIDNMIESKIVFSKQEYERGKYGDE